MQTIESKSFVFIGYFSLISYILHYYELPVYIKTENQWTWLCFQYLLNVINDCFLLLFLITVILGSIHMLEWASPWFQCLHLLCPRDWDQILLVPTPYSHKDSLSGFSASAEFYAQKVWISKTNSKATDVLSWGLTNELTHFPHKTLQVHPKLCWNDFYEVIWLYCRSENTV